MKYKIELKLSTMCLGTLGVRIQDLEVRAAGAGVERIAAGQEGIYREISRCCERI